jgi:hypothetical protein
VLRLVCAVLGVVLGALDIVIEQNMLAPGRPGVGVERFRRQR